MLTLLPGTGTVAHIFLYALAFFTLVQLVYLWLVWGKFGFMKHKPVEGNYQAVSVVIAAKNEYYNLNRNLPFILDQDYPEYEVVVVNDASDDDSADLLEDFSRKYPALKVVTIKENLNFFHGKKFPLSIGIKSAAHDVLVLTDADCMPAGRNWLKAMQGPFSNNDVQIVLGYGAYESTKGLLNRLIRYETLWTAIQYFSMAALGSPYMGVGRNLAYRKNFFYSKKGFTSHYQIPSGDDDLFVNQNGSGKNTRICFDPEAHTISKAKVSFQAWFAQKKRHLTTGRMYRFKHKFTLASYNLSALAVYTLAALLMCVFNEYIVSGSLLGLKIISHLLVIKKSMNKLSEKNLLLFSPFFELFFMLFLPLTYISGILNPVKKWK